MQGWTYWISILIISILALCFANPFKGPAIIINFFYMPLRIPLKRVRRWRFLFEEQIKEPGDPFLIRQLVDINASLRKTLRDLEEYLEGFDRLHCLDDL